MKNKLKSMLTLSGSVLVAGALFSQPAFAVSIPGSSHPGAIPSDGAGDFRNADPALKDLVHESLQNQRIKKLEEKLLQLSVEKTALEARASVVEQRVSELMVSLTATRQSLSGTTLALQAAQQTISSMQQTLSAHSDLVLKVPAILQKVETVEANHASLSRDYLARAAALEQKTGHLQDRVVGGRQTVVVEGANLMVINGLGSTTTANGVGNLILGYSEAPGLPAGETLQRGGSHNLIVGPRHQYLTSGSIIAGNNHSIIRASNYSAIIGGENSDIRTSGLGNVIVGGSDHWISDRVIGAEPSNACTILGGEANSIRGSEQTMLIGTSGISLDLRSHTGISGF